MKISQREAKRLRKRVDELERAIENQRATYSQEWFYAVQIGAEEMTRETATAIRTARRLRHAVVVVGDETDTIKFMALPSPKGTR